MNFVNPDQQSICNLLGEINTIAIVGLSPNNARPSFRVAEILLSFGYHIVPVRPQIESILGAQAYPDLESIPFQVDLVDVFRASEHVPNIVKSCIKLSIKKLWLQDGVINEKSALLAQQSGITVVMNRCMARDLFQLCNESEQARIIATNSSYGV
jgi:predicted CoA-binding protein